MTSRARLVRAVAIVLASLALAPSAHAMIGGAYVSAGAEHDDAIAALGFANRVGLEGPLPSPDDTWHCTATLIAPSLAITARHCLVVSGAPVDPTSLALVFRRNPDGSLGATDPESRDRGLSSFHRVRVSGYRLPASSSDDVALVELATPVTHIAPLALALDGAHLARGSAIRMAGWGREGRAADAPQVGLRTCGSQLTGTLTFPRAEEAACGPAAHDSGSPIFVRSSSGEERIIGIVTSDGFGEHLAELADVPELDALAHTPWEGPELSVESVEHELRFFRIGEEVELRVVLRNSGTEAASGRIEVELDMPDGDRFEATPQHLHTEPAGAPVPAGGTLATTLRFVAPPDVSQTMHALAVRIVSSGDVLVANDRALPPAERANFYAVPRLLAYRDLYFAFVYGASEPALLGAISVYERGDGSFVVLAVGPGGGEQQVLPAIGADRVLAFSTGVFSPGEDPIEVRAPVPVLPVGERSTGEPLVADPPNIQGQVIRDDRFAPTVLVQGHANPGAGLYQGTFTDAGGGAVSAMVMPLGNVLLVATTSAEFYEEVELTGAYGFAQWAEDPISWGSFEGFVGGTASIGAAQRFDADVAQYVVEGTWTVGDVVRPFRLVRQPGLARDGDPCHDDDECIEPSSRCAPDVRICMAVEPSQPDASTVDRDAGASDARDAGAPRSAPAGCGCRAASSRRAPVGWLLLFPLLALVRLAGSRSRSA